MTSEQDSKLSPSHFMRQLRPEFYSDSADRVSYLLDAKMLEYCLDSITSRNEMHDFEIFCRKLCERMICPNLKPSTGPEGGGDSKADAETYPVAEEIAEHTYIGNIAAGQERWAFAFSAKKKWAEKVRSDVAGIVATQRGYKKIICVTAQFAPAKKRAQLEDELSELYGVIVTILDRSWIVDKVIDHDHSDLAYHYLHVGQEVADSRRLGPSDYSRNQQLEDLEQALARPDEFKGMEMQRATEALVAAKLSRNLERPRTETDGRFERAIRLAARYGNHRQRFEAHYEKLWTAFWWFDDIALMNEGYDAFEQLVLDTDHARDLELLCNLAQLLFNSVIHQHLTVEEAQLDERIRRLRERLTFMAAELERPNHALEARTSLLVLDVNRALLEGDQQLLSALWPQFSQILGQARGLGEFSADRLINLIEAFGNVAANNPGYAALVDEMAAFVAERTGEAQGALVLLKRARQLDFKDNFEMIRLLGKAVRQLTKKEYSEPLIEASQLLALAYRSAGLLWAARASCIFAVASMFIAADEDHDLPASIVPTLMILVWITVELRHLPDLLEAVRLVRGCANGLPLDDESQGRVQKRLGELDLILTCQLVNLNENSLRRITQLPEVLERLGLMHSRNALLYVLGHEAKLREEGTIPEQETPEQVAELFSRIASQPAGSNADYPMIFNEGASQYLVSRVQGMLVSIQHPCTETSIPLAEAILGIIEALFATALQLRVAAHTECFRVTVQEVGQHAAPGFNVNDEDMTASVAWPSGLATSSHARTQEIQQTLIHLATTIFAATCHVPDLETTLDQLFENEAVLDRIAMIVTVGNSRQRLFNHSFSTITAWSDMANTEFALEPKRPVIKRVPLTGRSNETAEDDEDGLISPGSLSDHRQLGVRSVIDVHLWDQAGWRGVAVADLAPNAPPALALMFTDAGAARKIFARWRERLGSADHNDEIYVAVVQGISREHPAHYRLLITSTPPETEAPLDRKKVHMMVSRMQTMEASSDANLLRFLAAYQRTGAYLLLPAVFKAGQPELLFEMAILKRKLVVRSAADIGKNDLEVMALGSQLYRERFGEMGVGDGEEAV
ncbi:tetratricopeptide repeat protein [Pseudomonas aeruginosa]|uniref:tetratricopeptide repeat protein n=1 Tax=Pseudomonas aeruginosa TaxID=287 RepID=UPI001067E7EB|nr:tetratricopeptide repeat protein [Pseudomonas aeruginosa]MBH8864896.1 tetratricopeptide repeat protein [Pseudomonas aeruginosa]TEQ19301.1 tetratricopeptide repeat protein [Pseudomonas aeruginosa]HDY6082255.1 tetratricopeptide repeat protein [Pseudomonas aeruginosa]HEP9025716.1 tetratricopeptide repeat protein [Pseudomonas aeruginosa]